jgi:hypothetical protein
MLKCIKSKINGFCDFTRIGFLQHVAHKKQRQKFKKKCQSSAGKKIHQQEARKIKQYVLFFIPQKNRAQQ